MPPDRTRRRAEGPPDQCAVETSTETVDRPARGLEGERHRRRASPMHAWYSPPYMLGTLLLPPPPPKGKKPPKSPMHLKVVDEHLGWPLRRRWRHVAVDGLKHVVLRDEVEREV